MFKPTPVTPQAVIQVEDSDTEQAIEVDQKEQKLLQDALQLPCLPAARGAVKKLVKKPAAKVVCSTGARPLANLRCQMHVRVLEAIVGNSFKTSLCEDQGLCGYKQHC